MLVLSRREGDEIVFPDLGITVVVNKVKGKSISIGIDAPKEHRVLRGELAFEQPSQRNGVRYTPARRLSAKGFPTKVAG